MEYRTSTSSTIVDDNLLNIKIAVLGKSLVGKTALTYRFINDKFPTKSDDTTIEDQYIFQTEIDGIKCKLEILDTAGQDDYKNMIDTWIHLSDGFILVYSIDDKDSFEEIKLQYQRIIKNKGKNNFSLIIVGNKCDLNDSKRKVSTEEANIYCDGLKIHFLETSALNRINVKETFLCVARTLLQMKLNNKNNDSNNSQSSRKKCLCF